MSVELKQNLSAILRALEERGMKTTNIAKSMGYTTTSQLHSIIDGDSLVSTKAIISMIENLKVNPNYLFLGKGAMFLTDEDEIEELRKKVHELEHNHSEAVKTVFALNEIIQKLEKRNADLIDLTSAAIKYHKGQKQDETENTTDSSFIDNRQELMKKLHMTGVDDILKQGEKEEEIQQSQKKSKK